MDGAERLAQILLVRLRLIANRFAKKSKSSSRSKKLRKITAQKPRPRGRPRKIKAKKAGKTKKVAEIKVANEVKRPRGRPRKVASDTPPPVRRGRGRPPGSKNVVRPVARNGTSENHSEIVGTNGHSLPSLASTAQPRIRELIKLAKEQGYLTFDDLNEALPPDLNDADELDAYPDPPAQTGDRHHRGVRGRPLQGRQEGFRRGRGETRSQSSTSSTIRSGCISSRWARCRC